LSIVLIAKALLIARPAKPDEKSPPFDNTENNEANKTMKLPINSNLMPSHKLQIRVG
jgi:hypothetical protein